MSPLGFQWRFQMGRSRYGPKFSYFHADFGEIWQICMLASLPGGWRRFLRGILEPALVSKPEWAAVLAFGGAVRLF